MDGDAPATFVEEVSAAASLTPGLARRGVVEVRTAPYPCSVGLCSGEAPGPFHVIVVYSEEHGLGPELGTTALEHELCHASGIWEEDEANRCAASVVRLMQN